MLCFAVTCAAGRNQCRDITKTSELDTQHPQQKIIRHKVEPCLSSLKKHQVERHRGSTVLDLIWMIWMMF